MYLPIEEFEGFVETLDGSDLDFEMNGIVLTLQDVRMLDGRAILYRDQHGNQLLNGVTSSPMALHLSNPYQLRRSGEAVEFLTQLSIKGPLPSHVEGRIMLFPDLIRSGFMPSLYPIPVGFSGHIRFPITPMMRSVVERGVDIGVLRFIDIGSVPAVSVETGPVESPAKRGRRKKDASDTSGTSVTPESDE